MEMWLDIVLILSILCLLVLGWIMYREEKRRLKVNYSRSEQIKPSKKKKTIWQRLQPRTKERKAGEIICKRKVKKHHQEQKQELLIDVTYKGVLGKKLQEYAEIVLTQKLV